MENSIKWKSKVIESANILRMICGTNIPCGGDSGHGGKTILKLVDECSTCWNVYVNGQLIENSPNSVTIEMQGDSEGETLIEALEKAVEYLKQIKSKNTEKYALLQNNK